MAHLKTINAQIALFTKSTIQRPDTLYYKLALLNKSDFG